MNYEQIFNIFDKNCDGYIDVDDLIEVMSSVRSVIDIRFDRYSLAKLIRKITGNSDYINYSQFVEYAKKRTLITASTTAIASAAPTIEKLKKIFDFFDTDHSGYISFENLSRAMNRIGLESLSRGHRIGNDRIVNIFALLDTDNNGKISFEEFSNKLGTLCTNKNTKKMIFLQRNNEHYCG